MHASLETAWKTFHLKDWGRNLSYTIIRPILKLCVNLSYSWFRCGKIFDMVFLDNTYCLLKTSWGQWWCMKCKRFIRIFWQTISDFIFSQIILPVWVDSRHKTHVCSLMTRYIFLSYHTPFLDCFYPISVYYCKLHQQAFFANKSGYTFVWASSFDRQYSISYSHISLQNLKKQVDKSLLKNK